jgi:hypothetical protein
VISIEYRSCRPARPAIRKGTDVTCINLKRLAGDRYRVSRDTEAAGGPRDDDPWLWQMPGRCGLIDPRGADTLGVQVDGHRLRAGHLRRRGRWVQGADRETTVVVPAEDCDAVAALVRPDRRRHDSPVERAAQWLRAEHARKSIKQGVQTVLLRGSTPSGGRTPSEGC